MNERDYIGRVGSLLAGSLPGALGSPSPEEMKRQRELAGQMTWRDMLTEAETLQLTAEMERRAEEIVRARSSPEAIALIYTQRR